MLVRLTVGERASWIYEQMGQSWAKASAITGVVRPTLYKLVKGEQATIKNEEGLDDAINGLIRAGVALRSASLFLPTSLPLRYRYAAVDSSGDWWGYNIDRVPILVTPENVSKSLRYILQYPKASAVLKLTPLLMGYPALRFHNFADSLHFRDLSTGGWLPRNQLSFEICTDEEVDEAQERMGPGWFSDMSENPITLDR